MLSSQSRTSYFEVVMPDALVSNSGKTASDPQLKESSPKARREQG